MCVLLGLRTDEEKAEKARQDAQETSNENHVVDDNLGAAIPVSDEIPEERVVVHEPDKSIMDIGTVYPDMVAFRLAMIQFAINEEFELKIVKTDPTRYIADCKVEGCPWHIVGRRQPDGRTIKVTVLLAEHNCTSSARRKTKTPTCDWVASKAVQILMEKAMGTKELRDKLQKHYKCEIHYDMAWKGRQKAMKELYGYWEQSSSVVQLEGKECLNNWIRDIKDLPVHELADKLYEMIMVLWEKRRRIASKLTGKILPAVLHQLKARTRGLGHLSVVKADSVSAQIWDSSNTHNRHVVKAHLHDCSCLEWQHTGKPCQHALALITAQQNRDVKLEDYVHHYYLVELFQRAYSRLIEPLPDRTQWPYVELPFVVGAPLHKRGAGRTKKLRFKSFLEEGGGKNKKGAKEAANEVDRAATEEVAEAEKGKKKMIRGKRKCKKCGELGHGETSYKCPLNGTKKRKRKARKNTTKDGENAKLPTKKKTKQQVVQDLTIQEDSVQENAQVFPTPTRPTRESIMQESPIRVTRGCWESHLVHKMFSPSSIHHQGS